MTSIDQRAHVEPCGDYSNVPDSAVEKFLAGFSAPAFDEFLRVPDNSIPARAVSMCDRVRFSWEQPANSRKLSFCVLSLDISIEAYAVESGGILFGAVPSDGGLNGPVLIYPTSESARKAVQFFKSKVGARYSSI